MTEPGDEPTTTRLPGPWWAVSIAKVREPSFRGEAAKQITGDARPLLGFVVGLTIALILGPFALSVLFRNPLMEGSIAVALGMAFMSSVSGTVFWLLRLIRQLGL